MPDGINGSACANCGAALSGAYCASCGQKSVAPRPTLHEFFHEVTHEFLHVDGKIFRTLKLLLFAPGALTAEFNAGRRRASISPVRVYLICSLLFFGALALNAVHSGGMGVTYRPTSSAASGKATELEKRIEAGVGRAQRDPAALQRQIQRAFPKAMFVLMPVHALLLLMTFRRAEPLYVPHLYASIHLHSFAFAAFALALVASIPGWAPLRLLSFLLVVSTFPYYFLALRRIYGTSRLATFVRGTVAGALYFVLLLATTLIVVLYAVTHV